jgi:hypothetical protein
MPQCGLHPFQGEHSSVGFVLRRAEPAEDLPAAAATTAAASNVHAVRVWQLGGHMPQRGLHSIQGEQCSDIKLTYSACCSCGEVEERKQNN